MLDFGHAREWLLPRLKTPLTWIYVTIGLALSAAAGHFLQSHFLAGFEKAAGFSASVVEGWTCQRRKASIKLSDQEFSVLVSPLQGDPNGTQTAKIFVALAGRGDIQLLQVCQSLQIHIGDEYVTEQIKAVQRGRDILKEWHADLILFGKVVADTSLHVWTINEHGGCDFSAKPVVLTNGALPGEFERETKTKLLGAVLKEIAAACNHDDDMNWDLFKRQMRKLTVLMSRSTLDFQEDEQLQFSTSYYNGLNLLYHHDGDEEWFEDASSFAKFEVSKGRTDFQKANAMYFYGRALLSKRLKTNDVDALNLSIKVFEQFLRMVHEPEWRADALVMRSDAHKLKGDAELAIRDLDEAILLIPASAPETRRKALVARSDAHKLKGDAELAIRDLDEAILLIPASAPSAPETRTNALIARSDLHSLKGDAELAIRDLDEAIRLSPKNAGALNSRCYELAKIGRLELALADCNESLNLLPNDPATLDSRGFTYLKLKRPDSAINDYDAVLRLDPKQAYSLYGRGLAYLMLGNKDQGNQDIAAAKAIKADIADELARYGVK